MNLKQLFGKLGNPSINGIFEVDTKKVDPTREVIVQVFEGYEPNMAFDGGDSEWLSPKYSYHKVKTAGMLFYDGEFKIVIAAYPYFGESDEE